MARSSGYTFQRLYADTAWLQQLVAEELRPRPGRIRGRARDHFARLFRRSTGDPPHRFVIRQRITRACEFLARSELTIAEISRQVGFRTPSHFNTMFRRVSGV